MPWLALALARSSFLTLERAPLEALVVPGGNLVHVHTDDTLAGLRARVVSVDSADSDAGLRGGVFRQAPEPSQQPVGRANPLAHERRVGAVVVPASRGDPAVPLLPFAEAFQQEHRCDDCSCYRPGRRYTHDAITHSLALPKRTKRTPGFASRGG